jgi:hypothetical protein
MLWPSPFLSLLDSTAAQVPLRGNIGPRLALLWSRGAPLQENIMADQYTDEPTMPADATRNLMIWASGFGIGALLILFAFVFLIGVGGIHQTSTSPATPAAQSAANAPVAPGPAPNPSPNTAAPAVPETTGHAPAPANPATPKAPTQGQTQK